MEGSPHEAYACKCQKDVCEANSGVSVYTFLERQCDGASLQSAHTTMHARTQHEEQTGGMRGMCAVVGLHPHWGHRDVVGRLP